MRAGGSALVGIAIGCGYAEFLDCFGIESEYGAGYDAAAVCIERAQRECVAGARDLGITRLLIIDVDAIERDVGLIGTRTRNLPFFGGAGLQA